MGASHSCALSRGLSFLVALSSQAGLRQGFVSSSWLLALVVHARGTSKVGLAFFLSFFLNVELARLAWRCLCRPNRLGVVCDRAGTYGCRCLKRLQCFTNRMGGWSYFFFLQAYSWSVRPACWLFAFGVVWHSGLRWLRQQLAKQLLKPESLGEFSAQFLRNELAEPVSWAINTIVEKSGGLPQGPVLDLCCGPGNSIAPLLKHCGTDVDALEIKKVEQTKADKAERDESEQAQEDEPLSGKRTKKHKRRRRSSSSSSEESNAALSPPKLPNNFELHAVDWSAEMHKYLANRFDSELLLSHKITLHQNDARDLSFKDDFFDLVLVFNVLHMFDDLPALLHGVQRVLKPGGTLAVSFFDSQSLLRQSYIQSGVLMGIYKVRSLESITGYLGAQNFTQIQTETVDIELGDKEITYVLVTAKKPL